VPPCDRYQRIKRPRFVNLSRRTFSRCVRATSIHQLVPLSKRHGTLVVAHIYFRAIHSRWLTVLRLPTTLVDGSFLSRYSRNTDNQLEVACADRPGRLGWFPAQGGLQTPLPGRTTSASQVCKPCMLSLKIVRSQQGVR
jgi:hypothetical protein